MASVWLTSLAVLCRTPLMLAVLGGHTDCVVLLLERGACPDLRDRKGRTALHRAVSFTLTLHCSSHRLSLLNIYRHMHAPILHFFSQHAFWLSLETKMCRRYIQDIWALGGSIHLKYNLLCSICITTWGNPFALYMEIFPHFSSILWRREKITFKGFVQTCRFFTASICLQSEYLFMLLACS